MQQAHARVTAFGTLEIKQRVERVPCLVLNAEANFIKDTCFVLIIILKIMFSQ